jgi:hypothetical protein
VIAGLGRKNGWTLAEHAADVGPDADPGAPGWERGSGDWLHRSLASCIGLGHDPTARTLT